MDYLHTIKKACFIHVVGVLRCIFYKNFPQARYRLVNEYHVDWTTLTKATVRFDTISTLKRSSQPVKNLNGKNLGKIVEGRILLWT